MYLERRLKKLDFPTLGMPTMPIFTLLLGRPNRMTRAGASSSVVCSSGVILALALIPVPVSPARHVLVPQTRKDAGKQGHTTGHGYRKAQWTRLTLLGRHLRRDCTAWIALVTQTPAVKILHPDLAALKRLKRGRQSLSSLLSSTVLSRRQIQWCTPY